jgi:hypothetical protein
MRFGKRRDKNGLEGDGAPDAAPGAAQVTEDWPAPDAADGAVHSMAPPESDAPPASAPESVVEPEPVEAEAEAEPVFEGEAVELPYDPAAASEPEPAYDAPAYEAPAYEQVHDPAPAYAEVPAYEPPAPHPIEPDPVARLADSTPHHEPGVNPARGGAWPEPAFDLAERPEILVGAAFGGGLLLALIIRRLGH